MHWSVGYTQAPAVSQLVHSGWVSVCTQGAAQHRPWQMLLSQLESSPQLAPNGSVPG
jgi:hypothetical protein